MASGIRVELNHSDIEEIVDSYADLAMQYAESICDRANAMRADSSVAEYNVRFGRGPSKRYRHSGGRRYAVVSADAPSTKADNARNNTLAKAMG